MYLVLDKRAPWRYTRGPFVFLDGLKSRLRVSDIRRIYGFTVYLRMRVQVCANITIIIRIPVGGNMGKFPSK